MSRIKVFHVINGLGAGGAERSLAELLPYFDRSGIDPVIVCTFRRQEGVHDQVRRLGVEVVVLDGARMPTRIRALRRLIRGHRPAVVHTTIFESDLMGRVAAAGTGVPVLTSLVNTSYDPIRVTADPNVSALKLNAVRLVDGFTARHLTTWFHAITHAVRDSAVAAMGIDPDRITVVERGRDPARLGTPDAGRRAQVREELGIAADAEVILNVGRQEYQKGQRHLLEAAERVLRERPRAVLLVAGRPGNASSELERIHAGLTVRDRVRFLGHRSDVPDLLRAADVFVFPSLFEGLGGAVIEAMALGLPIVGSRIPALVEVVEEGRNARLVAAGSGAALGDALMALLDDPSLRRSYGEKSREIFSARFSLDRVGSRMAALLHEVADMRRNARASTARNLRGGT